MLKDDGKWSVLESIIGIQLILIMLKLIGFINLGWFWVLTPSWISIIIAILVIVLIVIGIDKLIDFIKGWKKNGS